MHGYFSLISITDKAFIGLVYYVYVTGALKETGTYYHYWASRYTPSHFIGVVRVVPLSVFYYCCPFLWIFRYSGFCNVYLPNKQQLLILDTYDGHQKGKEKEEDQKQHGGAPSKMK